MIMICYLYYLILSEFIFLIHFKTEYKVLNILNEDKLFNVEITDEF